MTDAYRARHPDAWEHSWFGRGGNGYRIDHIFVTRQHVAQVRCCGYLQAQGTRPHRSRGHDPHTHARTGSHRCSPVSAHQRYHQQADGASVAPSAVIGNGTVTGAGHF
jgi:hypothetical protein